MPDRSYSDRSAVSTKRSAASSLSKLGSFFFITGNLLRMHVASADRTDEHLSCPFAQSEYDQHTAAGACSADGLQPLLFVGVSRVAKQRHRPWNVDLTSLSDK